MGGPVTLTVENYNTRTKEGGERKKEIGPLRSRFLWSRVPQEASSDCFFPLLVMGLYGVHTTFDQSTGTSVWRSESKPSSITAPRHRSFGGAKTQRPTDRTGSGFNVA